MKALLTSGLIALGMTVSASAELTAKITGVHLCCGGCARGVEKALADVKDVKAAVDEDSGSVTLTGPDQTAVQKAADALAAGGYFGKSSDSRIKMTAETGAKGEKVQALKLEGVHLCCRQCVTALDTAVKSVAGVKEHNAARGAASFEVKGDFNDKELVEAIQKAGLNARVAK